MILTSLKTTLRFSVVLLAIFSAAVSACTTPTVSPVNRPGTLETLINDLKAAGAQVEMAETNQDPFFSATGQTIKVNDKSVIVYEYKDEAARKTESDTISTDGFSVGNTKVDWVDQPNFWGSGRIIVLYVGKDASIIDLFTQRLGDPLTQSQ